MKANTDQRANRAMKTPCSVKSRDLLTEYRRSKRCDAAVRLYLDAALSDNTMRAYQGDLKHFLEWGGAIPATPECVARYVARHATLLACATLSRRLVAIDRAHTARGVVSPTKSELVKATMKGVRRTRGNAVRQVAPLQKMQVLQMVKGLRGTRGLRDKALLLIGFASALRRSELVSLNVEDLRFSDEGTTIRLRRSKTDQVGQGREIAIPRVRSRNCPSRALQAWIQHSGIATGPVFRRVNRYDQLLPQRLAAQSVALIVKNRAELAGLDPRMFSGHSLRAGFVTNATRSGASSSSIRRQTGHKSDAMLQRYIRNSQLFSDNPNRKIW